MGLEHEELGFGFQVAAVGAGPESGPPNLEPEDGSEAYVFKLS